MKILFSGGGTLGPVTPLLGIYEAVKTKYPQAEFVFVGTKNGPERQLVEKYNIKFITISSGKWRRYFSGWNFFDWFKILFACLQSSVLLLKEKPSIVITAGGFVSVPVHLAAWLHGIPSWIHQQDARVGLANKIMARFATQITVALKDSIKFFSSKKTVWLGNPVRADIYLGSLENARNVFKLKPDLPTVLATGGGTGSQKVNELILGACQHLVNKAQIIHLTGPERDDEMSNRAKELLPNYHPYKFLTSEMKDAYKAADIVISRAGFGTLSELAALKKPAIIIPLPGHQEENALYFSRAGAIIEVDQNFADPYKLAKTIEELLENKEKAMSMAQRFNEILPPASAKNILEVFNKILE